MFSIATYFKTKPDVTFQLSKYYPEPPMEGWISFNRLWVVCAAQASKLLDSILERFGIQNDTLF